MNINKVLVADAVDQACVGLLKNNSIDVDCKYKLNKEQLIQEVQVGNLQNKYGTCFSTSHFK